MENKIYIIGIGPGSSEYLTKKAVDTVKTSDYTVGSTRAIDLFDDVNNKIAFNVKDLLDKLEKGALEYWNEYVQPSKVIERIINFVKEKKFSFIQIIGI